MKNRLKDYQARINAALECYVKPEELEQKSIFEAMGYSLHAGGKRLRPVLVLEFARICGAAEDDAMPFACAMEMIHTYSLIHDDLPCMDNDTLRRGRPTNHVVYGEALALLAGDALLTRAFEITLEKALDTAGKTPEQIRGMTQAVQQLAVAAGAYGMIGGQVIDMEGEGKSLNRAQITRLQELKTGALIRASAKIGCLLGGASDEKLEAAIRYADALGLAFQIQDDILDVEGDPALLGKSVGTDEQSEKSTFVRHLGLEGCKARVAELTDTALEALDAFENAEFLIWLTKELAGRSF